MSYPYRGATKDYKSSAGSYSPSEHVHGGRRDAYRPSREPSAGTASSCAATKSALESYSSQRSSTAAHALSILASCGLDPEDLSQLAGMPDELITVETLPHLLIEIKEKKVERAPARSATRSAGSGLLPHPPADEWRGGTRFCPNTEAPRRSFCPPPEKRSEDWHDHSRDSRGAASAPLEAPRSRSGYAMDYNYGQSRAAAGSSYEGPAGSSRFGNEQDGAAGYHGVDRSGRSRVEWKPSSGYWGKDGVTRAESGGERSAEYRGTVRGAKDGDVQRPLAGYWGVEDEARRDGGRDRVAAYRDTDGGGRAAYGRDVQEGYERLDRAAHTGNGHEHLADCRGFDRNARTGNGRDRAMDYQGASRVVRDGNGRERLAEFQGIDKEMRAGGSPGPSTDYRRAQGSVRAGYTQESSTERWGIDRGGGPAPATLKKDSGLSKRPTKQEADDFHGVKPQIFPYACSLCDIVVLSERDWTLHINGSRHADGQLSILQMYPEWDCRNESAQGDRLQPEPKRETEKPERSRYRAAQFPAVRPDHGEVKSVKDKERSRVIRVKFPANSMDESCFMELSRPFGTAVNVSLFPTMALLEMNNCLKAQELVNFYNKNPIIVRGCQVEFSLSTTCIIPQSSRVVCFSRLPPGKEKNAELIAMAKRFGKVKHSLFLPTRVFVEMANAEDAEKLVDHYASNPLKMKGKHVLVSYSKEYNTLKDENSDTDSEGGQRPKRCRRSPSPRRRSAETEGASKNDTKPPAGSPKDTTVEVKGEDRGSIGAGGSSGSPPSALSQDPDSDIEGMEVIGEDGEDIMTEEGADKEDGPSGTGESAGELEPCTAQAESSNGTMDQPSKKQTVPPVMEHERAVGSPTHGAELSREPSPGRDQENMLMGSEEEDPGFPESLENCITLDELEDEDEDEEGETNAPVVQESSGQTSRTETEDHYNGKVIYIKNLPQTYYTDAEFVKIVKGFGKVKRYFLIRTHQEGFIEMDTAEDARRAVKELVWRRAEMRHSPLMINLSRKYKTLTSGWAPDPDSEEEEELRRERRARNIKKEEEGDSQTKSDTVQEELPAKSVYTRPEEAQTEELGTAVEQECKQQEQEGEEQAGSPEASTDREVEEEQDGGEQASTDQEVEEEQDGDEQAGSPEAASKQGDEDEQGEEQAGFPEAVSDQEEMDVKTEDSEMKADQPSDSTDALMEAEEKPTCENDGCGLGGESVERTHEEEQEVVMAAPDGPVGQEFVRPVVGYYCSLCEAIYASEEEAKNEHCATLAHYQKFKARQASSSVSGPPASAV